MFRVVTVIHDHRGAVVLDKGPWFPSQPEAEAWAAALRQCGYRANIESMDGDVKVHKSSPDADLAEALKNMA